MAGFDRSDTALKVINILSQELNIDKGTITEEKSLTELGADSLDTVKVMMKLEESFGIEISDQDAEKAKTVKDIIDYIQNVRAQ